ncbi:hypothetical protein HZB89_00075 [archaeon]|nr:hypothetical protein [archaeon]
MFKGFVLAGKQWKKSRPFNELKWLKQVGIRMAVASQKKIISRPQAIDSVNKLFKVEEDPKKRLYFLDLYANACKGPKAMAYLESEKKIILHDLRVQELQKQKKIPVGRPITSFTQAVSAFYSMVSLVEKPEEQLKFLNTYINSCKDSEAFKFLSNQRHELLVEEKLMPREADVGMALDALRAPIARANEVESSYNRPLLVYSVEGLNKLGREFDSIILKMKHSRIRGRQLREFEAKRAAIDTAISLQNALGAVEGIEKTKWKAILQDAPVRKRYTQLLASTRNGLNGLLDFEAGKKDAVNRYSNYLENIKSKLGKIAVFEREAERKQASLKKKDWKGRY